jgi:hypothetical protein
LLLFSVSGDLVASASSGYGEYCDEGIPTEAALLSLLAAFAVSFGILYRASTTNTGRKKRDLGFAEKIQDLFWTGKKFSLLFIFRQIAKCRHFCTVMWV